MELTECCEWPQSGGLGVSWRGRQPVRGPRCPPVRTKDTYGWGDTERAPGLCPASWEKEKGVEGLIRIWGKVQEHIYIIIFVTLFFLFNIVFLRIQPLLWIFNLCFLVFVINFVPLRTQSSLPIFTWEWDHWPDSSLPLWNLFFLHQVTCVFSLAPLFSTQLCEFLCVPDGGEHLGNWLLAGSVSLLLIPPFYPPGHFCFLQPSSLNNFVNISEWSSCGVHIRKWLLGSLLSPLLILPHLIWVTSNTLLPLLFSM